ncbi:MAG: Flp pilus assembly complex ATPase component [Deltaproteobacteria bacterium]|nr:Flp pilus assembly complex ATPase component [Deltaproteobacteria bacterium]
MALLGEILLKNNVVTTQTLGVALSEQKRTGELMGDVLVRLGFISQTDLSKALAIASDIQFVDLQQTAIDPEAINTITKETAKKFNVVPFAITDGRLQVAMDNPNDIIALDTLRHETGMAVDIFAADILRIADTIEMYYEVGFSLGDEIDANIRAAMGGAMVEGENQAPIIRLVDLFIINAIRDTATDLHITPEEKSTRISYRIDGILQSSFVLPKQLHLPIINRVKIISGMDIAENRLPQGGSINFAFINRHIDIRCSSTPCSHGENLVLRILDKASAVLDLKYLGLDQTKLNTIEQEIIRPHGIILACGPTGAGKTTTLYSILRRVNALEKNVLTIEDPIEYNLPLIKQTQVNESAGLTFSMAIKYFLRQDPDIILVGEIRDLETAQIAMQAAMTGHLVLSTLHTNDAAAAIPRLLNLGVESFLIPSTLRSVISQRLARKVCRNCAVDYRPAADELAQYDLPEDWLAADQSIKKAVGCDKCGDTGYRGRTGVFEILKMSAAISALISQKSSSDIIMRQAVHDGMKTIREDGLSKVLAGLTSLEEIFRIT